MTARSRIAEKIAALRSKTRAAGCTEAEALAAAELAARLMRDHGLAEDDIVMSEAAHPERTSTATWRASLVSAISGCTNTVARLFKGEEWRFVGREPGPQIAVYLCDVCFRAVATGEREFRSSTFYRRRRAVRTKRAALADFRDGMVHRLMIRLYELFGPSVDRIAIEAARDELERRFGEGRALTTRERETAFDEARRAGWSAGSRTGLHHGVGGDPRPVGLLGKPR